MLSVKSQFARRGVGIICGLILVVIAAAVATASAWVPRSPTAIDPLHRLVGPSSSHWFGTDNLGRDVFSRTVYGGRASLIVGFSVAVLATVFGSITGVVSGYYRVADALLMRVIDGVMAFPALILAMALVAALGGSTTNVAIALTVATWPIMTRVVRSVTLRLREEMFVEAAKASGCSDRRILSLYVLPNAVTPIIVQATFIFAIAILAATALSFLGLGVQPPTPSWGNMLGDSRSYITSAWWYSTFPGVAIVIVVMSLNLVGDALRDALDPRSR